MISDNADRLITSVDAGTNDGTAWTRPSSVPASSATLLVTQYTYNSAGWVYNVIDPMGIDTRTNYDNLGRIIQTIQDFTNGTETSDSNITTSYNYDGNRQVKVSGTVFGGFCLLKRIGCVKLRAWDDL
jgi:YD repeat-containing protein